MNKKELISNLKTILNSDDELKKSRVKILINDGQFDLSQKDIDSLLKSKKPRKKSDAKEE